MTIHSFNMAMELAGKAVLGYRRAKKEQWISTSTWDKIDQKERNKEKAAHHKVPKTPRKTFKRILTKRQRSKKEYQSRQTHLH